MSHSEVKMFTIIIPYHADYWSTNLYYDFSLFPQIFTYASVRNARTIVIAGIF